VVVLVVSVSVLQADTIYVPSEQPTIQAGIDAAVDGDTVLVAEGVYTGDGNRDIDFLGRAIVVKSENGAENCIIDCEGSETEPHRGFYFGSGEDSTSILQGFTIQNGYVYGDWPQNCGGGINCYSSSPTITGNKIMGNESPETGGGIFCYGSSPIITGNTITQNTTNNNGGGIYSAHSYSSPTIKGNTISGNTADWLGGGIYCWDFSPPVIEGNTISGNTAPRGGGIFYLGGSPTTITGNTITGNTATFDGGGIFCYSYSPTITGNTITGNTAENGGGIYCLSSEPIITNTIFWSNSVGIGDEICLEYYSFLTINYSDVDGSFNGIYIDPSSSCLWGPGMINEDPMFVDPEYGDYNLQSDSPCIDAGDPDMPCRPWGGWRLDMGAYEYDQGGRISSTSRFRLNFL
jgi:parallel beta-helix repeat protein